MWEAEAENTHPMPSGSMRRRGQMTLFFSSFAKPKYADLIGGISLQNGFWFDFYGSSRFPRLLSGSPRI
jgi:hypothetical protein